MTGRTREGFGPEPLPIRLHASATTHSCEQRRKRARLPAAFLLFLSNRQFRPYLPLRSIPGHESSLPSNGPVKRQEGYAFWRLTNPRVEASHLTMPSVTLSPLRDTKHLKRQLRVGKPVELYDRKTLIARIVPEKQSKNRNRWPDFESQAREVLGDRVLPGSDLVIAERGQP